MMKNPAEALPVRAPASPLSAPPFARNASRRRFAPLTAVRSIVLPIEARIIVLALCFRLVGASVGFIANVAIPDYQDQGFTVMAR
ncbi:MAG TPA: hypothetical protein VEA16_16740, partial [Vicinamibacterales bacterium]|nr:hypothetical protein [Vicinamibacterales bacterium]